MENRDIGNKGRGLGIEVFGKEERRVIFFFCLDCPSFFED
jgi:hypothetical protein